MKTGEKDKRVSDFWKETLFSLVVISTGSYSKKTYRNISITISQNKDTYNELSFQSWGHKERKSTY